MLAEGEWSRVSDTIAGDADPQTEQAAPAADERLAYRGVFQRMLIRPEIGAAIGAIAILSLIHI